MEEQIGDKIARLRRQNKVTQQKLAELAGVDYNTLRKVETNKTQNPNLSFIEKIAKALNVDIELLIETERPHTMGRQILPFQELSFGRFEELIFSIIKQNNEFIDVEYYGGSGDKKRDIVAKRKENPKQACLFQVKKYQKISSSELNQELDGIKKDHFTDPNAIHLYKKIYFCVSCNVSPRVKDKVKKHAKELSLPEPLFWDIIFLNDECRKDDNKHVIDNYFDGLMVEVVKKIDRQTKSILSIEKGLSEVQKTLSVSKTLPDLDISMQKISRLIIEDDYDAARDELLRIEAEIEKSKDKEKLKKLYNNFGVCYTNLQSKKEEDIKKGIAYFKKSLDVDNDFLLAKQNIIRTYINNGMEKDYKKALLYAKELIGKEPANLEFVGLYVTALYLSENFSEAKTVLEKHKEEEIVSNEGFVGIGVLVEVQLKDFEKATWYADEGLKKFPDSMYLNNLKGKLIQHKVELSLGAPSISTEVALEGISEALNYFERALKLALNSNPSDFLIINEIKFSIYTCTALLRKAQSTHFTEAIKKFDEIDKEINPALLPEPLHFSYFISTLDSQLTKDRDFNSAFQTFEKIKNKFDLSFDQIKDIAKKFYYHSSPEYSVKILRPLKEEAKNKADFEYWALLSMLYALLGDKNSAISTLNETRLIFKDSKEALSHYAAVFARYKVEDSENERLFEAVLKLDKKIPEEKILTPIRIKESDGSVSPEFQEAMTKISEEHKVRRDFFLTTSIPVNFLGKLFQVPYPEARQIPVLSLDFDFIIPYNSMDIELINYQKSCFERSNTFVADYSSLMNIIKSKQNGLIEALEKKILISEDLLFKIQCDLLQYESKELRDTWNFIRKDEVEIIPHRSFQNPILSEEMTHHFDVWLVQTIEYCKEKNIPLLSDDLKLTAFLRNQETNVEVVNSFFFFQMGQLVGKIDKRQYSLILGDLAEEFNIFIPFNGEDLLNIVLDDDRRGHLPSAIFKENPDLRVSFRVYHLLNQVNLPGSDRTSFIGVSLEFIFRLLRLSVTAKFKVNWVIFLSNFFLKDISPEDILHKQSMISEPLGFVGTMWIKLIEALEKSSYPNILLSLDKIENIIIRDVLKKRLSEMVDKLKSN